MGRQREEIEVEEKALEIIGRSYEGLRVLQMGAIEHKLPEPRMPAAEWYLAHGAKRVDTIDLNGRDGAIVHDLDQPVGEELRGRYHMVTNYGTGEHVNDQYMFFKNMHDVCKVGGVMVHALIHDGYYPGHGRYYYTTKTVFALARLCSYAVVSFVNNTAAGRDRCQRGLVVVAYRKRAVSHFPKSGRGFLRKAAIIDSGDTRRTGDYNTAGHGKLIP